MREDIEIKISRDLASDRYCSIVGPHNIGHTKLAKSIMKRLSENELISNDLLCIYIDLYDIRAVTKEIFYTEIFRKIRKAIFDSKFKDFVPTKLLDQDVSTSLDFRNNLDNIFEVKQFRILIIVDHLEGIPQFIVKSLLDCFQVMYDSRKDVKSFRSISVLTIGSIPMRDVTSFNTSPFRSNKYVLDDLQEEKVKLLLRETKHELAPIFTEEDANIIYSNIKGDIECVDFVREFFLDRVQSGNLPSPVEKKFIVEFMNNELRVKLSTSVSFKWAINIIELDINNLELITRMIIGEKIQPLSPEPMEYSFELSGAVIRENNEYMWRNQVWEDLIKGYFSLGYLAELFARKGHWNLVNTYIVPIINDQSSPILRASYLNSSVIAASDSELSKSFIGKILEILNSLFNVPKTINLALVDKKTSKIISVYSNKSPSDYSLVPGKKNGQIHENLAIFESIRLNRPYFLNNPNGYVNVVFPIVSTSRNLGGLIIYEMFKEDAYNENLINIRLIQDYVGSIADKLRRNLDSNEKNHSLKQWKIFSFGLVTLIVASNFQKVFNFSSVKGVFPISTVNFILMILVLMFSAILANKRQLNELTRNLLTIINIILFVGIIVIPDLMKIVFSSWPFLVILVLVLILIIYLFWKLFIKKNNGTKNV